MQLKALLILQNLMQFLINFQNTAVMIPVCAMTVDSGDNVTHVFQDDTLPVSRHTESRLTLDGGKIHVNEMPSVGGDDSAKEVEASFPDVQLETFHDSAYRHLEDVFQSADGKEAVQLKIRCQRLWRVAEDVHSFP